MRPHRYTSLLAVHLIAVLALGSALVGVSHAGVLGRTPAAPPPLGGPAMGAAGTVVAAGAPALPAGVSAPSFVVADLRTGRVLAARDPHQKNLPASCLKMLTALVLLPRLDPDRVVDADDADARVDGTRVGIVPKGRYTVGSLFAALLLDSGNDAAELLASSNGSRAQTLAQMNAEAQRLAAYDTVARTPSGLDAPGQTTSAYDLALIGRTDFADPVFRRYAALRQISFGAVGGKHFAVDNKNRLLRDDYPGALGGKDGWTTAAKHTFVGAATRGGRTYLVSMTRTDRTYGKQTEALLDWAFALPSTVRPVGTLVAPGTPRPTAPVRAVAAQQRSRPRVPLAGGPAAPPGTRTGVGWGAGALVLVVAGAALACLRNRRRHRPPSRT